MENIVRKGAWTKEEDMLLTECIQQYGEGRWYLVPARAGLKRCRKSCRMRWLNYLKPNLKRGSFAEDEVDLVLRMHKLLGNRWSLIAGRLPGRTANDVKNFWNTHICKKPKMATETCRDIVKPQPQNLSMSRLQYSNDKNVKNKNASSSNLQLSQERMCSSSALALQQDKDESIEWWRNLLQLSQINGEEDPAAMLPTSSPPQEDSMAGFFADFDVWLNI